MVCGVTASLGPAGCKGGPWLTHPRDGGSCTYMSHLTLVITHFLAASVASPAQVPFQRPGAMADGALMRPGLEAFAPYLRRGNCDRFFSQRGVRVRRTRYGQCRFFGIGSRGSFSARRLWANSKSGRAIGEETHSPGVWRSRDSRCGFLRIFA